MQRPEIATRAKVLKKNRKQQENEARASRALYVPLTAVSCLPGLSAGSFDAAISRILQNIAELEKLC